MSRIKWTEEKNQLLLKEYPKGNNKRLIPIFGASYFAIAAQAAKLGIKSKPQNHYKLKRMLEDTLENYYWMGFIMADGYITEDGELTVQTCRKDKGHLIKLAKKLDSNVIDREYKTTYGLCKTSCLTCKDIKHGVELKQKMNIVGQKTYNPPSLDFIKTDEQFLAFFAGFTDGDGCIGYAKNGRPYVLRIGCHRNWIKTFECIAQRLKKLGYKAVTSIEKRGYSILRMSTSGHILGLRNKFVEMNLPIMERKWFKVIPPLDKPLLP